MSDILHPSFGEGDQELAEELKPMVVGPPAYASPESESASGQLLPLAEHPNAENISDDYGKDVENADEGVVSTSASEDAASGDDSGREAWTKDEWVSKAEEYGLATSGTKQEVRDRVEEYERDNPDGQP